jgi:integrase
VTRPRLYVARPRHPLTGRQIRLSASTPRKLAELVGWIHDLKSELETGKRSADEVERLIRRQTVGSRTVADLADAYAEREDLAPETVRRTRSFVRGVGRALAGVELDALDAQACAAWVRAMRSSGAARTTVTQAWCTLRALVRYAAERGWIGRSPWGGWRPVSRSGGGRLGRECCRTPEELAALVAGADRVSPEVGDKVATSAGLGLRGRELARLDWADLDLTVGHSTAAIRSSAKNDPARVAVPPWLASRLRRRRAVLDAFLRARPEAARPRVFPPSARSARAGADPREVLTRRELRAAVAFAELPHPERWTPHSLRDSFVMIEHRRNGGDLAATARASRHASLSSLMRYLHDLERAPGPAEALEAPGGAPRPRLTP